MDHKNKERMLSGFMRKLLMPRRIEEGLIKTVAADKAISILRRLRFEVGNSAIYRDGIVFIVRISFDGAFNNSISKLLTVCNNLGWFGSEILIRNRMYKFNQIELLRIHKNSEDANSYYDIQFEAKFDSEDSLDPVLGKTTLLFHVTDEKFINKIKKIGLVPRSTSKLSTHPERIYLSKYEAAAMEMAKMMVWGGFIKNPYIIVVEIDPTKFRFMKDPNFYDAGIYTLQNIPPAAIIEIEKLNI